ncbi:MAG: tRNA lysidine(34) synthetase TilS [Rhizobiaceae bacterium]|nr:tRNA lysidine(34) synthetase TilS [Rhizobiaceae bacterium]
MSFAHSHSPSFRDGLSRDEGFELLARSLGLLAARSPLRLGRAPVECPIFDPAAPLVILAVSGGPDSLALLHLASTNAARLPVRFHVVTIDHALRAGSAEEAAAVGEIARSLGLAHETRRWSRRPAAGNLQAEARRARYELLTDTAFRIGAFAVMTAHHQDDQIETHFLAAARGAGDRGLAGMRAVRDLAPGLALLRPFLDVTSGRLKQTTAEAGLPAVDDSSNSDDRFDRVRLRKRLASGALDRNIAFDAISGHAARRGATDVRLADILSRLLDSGALVFGADGSLACHRDAFAGGPEDLMHDLLSRFLAAVSGRDHPPERRAVTRLASRIAHAREGDVATLGGVRVDIGAVVGFEREYGRSGPAEINLVTGARRIVFDGRFDIDIAHFTATHDGSSKMPSPDAVAGTIVPLGLLGKGNARERTLPVLLDPAQRPLGAHPLVLPKLPSSILPLSVRQRVTWRCLADLGLGGR